MIDPNDKSMPDETNGMLSDVPTSPVDQPLPDLDDLIALMFDKFALLDRYIDDHWDDMDVSLLIRALSVHSQCAVRLGNLLLDRQRARQEDSDRGLQEIMNLALDQVGQKFGLEL